MLIFDSHYRQADLYQFSSCILIAAKDHNKIINQELVGGALDKTQLHWGQPNNTKLPLIDLTRWPAPLFVISLSHFCNLLGTK